MEIKRNIVLVFLSLIILFIISGCSFSSSKPTKTVVQNMSTQKVYIKNDVNSYDSYGENKKFIKRLNRADEYYFLEKKADYARLTKSNTQERQHDIWVKLDEIETKKTYFISLKTNASKPFISIDEKDYKENMRLGKGQYQVKIKANNYLDKSLYIQVDDDLKKDITLEFDIELINKKIIEKKIEKDMKESVYIDEKQKLMWQDDDSSIKVKKTWLSKINFETNNYFNTKGDTAESYCTKLNIANFKDWRLPTKNELKDLLSKKQYLKNVSSNWYWSSSSNSVNQELAWSVFFDNADGYADFKNVSNYVRCVRDM